MKRDAFPGFAANLKLQRWILKLNKISAAVDFSTDELSLALRVNDAVATIRKSQSPPRDSSRIASWIVDQFRSLDLSVADAGSWTCGTGPGSFAALRCVAALTAGFATAGSDTTARGVPSALAIAAEAADAKPKAAKFAVLYDGRRGEALALPVRRGSQGFDLIGGSPIFPVAQGSESTLLDFDVLTAAKKEAKALESVLSKETFDKIIFIDSFPIERLLSIDDPKWNMESLLNPIYLRPATHVAPVTPRIAPESVSGTGAPAG